MSNPWEKGLAVLHDTDRDRFFDLLGKGKIKVSSGEAVDHDLYNEIVELGEKNE